MIKILASLCFTTAALAGCADPTTDSAPGDRDGLAEGAKADGPDVCHLYGFYDDGVCDLDCAQPDGDCAGAVVVRWQHDGGSAIVTHGQKVILQLGSPSPGRWQVTAVDRTLGQPESLWVPNLEQFTWTTDWLRIAEPLGGTHVVHLAYMLPGEPAPLGTFTIALDVRPS